MLNDIAMLIKGKCGFNFTDQESSVLSVAVSERMKVSGAADIKSYFDLVNRDDNELHHLVDNLTNNETYFMREPAHIDFLVDSAFPEIDSRTDLDKKIKIISAGCSTGEEPYSIVIALVEKYGPQVLKRVKIVGIDIDRNVLKKARAGLYGKHSFRKFDEGLKDKYFEDTEDGKYRIKKVCLDAVEFFHVNLMSESYAKEFTDSDIIFYRNVSIYFDAEAQQKIFKTLAQWLNNNGYIFVSSIETIVHDFGCLTLEGDEGVFYFKKVPPGFANQEVESEIRDECRVKDLQDKIVESVNTVKPQVNTDSSVVVPVGNIKDSKVITGNSACSFKDALHFARVKKYDKSLSVIESLLSETPKAKDVLTLKAAVLINLNKHDEAASCLEVLKSIDKFSFDASLLEGIVKKSINKSDEAEKKFKEALYIDSSSWLAHFYLAELYFSSGKESLALREYSVTKNIVRKHDGKILTANYFPVSFTVNELMNHCDNIINKINKKTY